ATLDGLYLSTDGGMNFGPPVGFPSPFVTRVMKRVDGTFLVGTGVGVYEASSSSGPWALTNIAPSWVTDLVETPAPTFPATTPGVFASTDGLTWAAVHGLAHVRPHLLAVDT